MHHPMEVRDLSCLPINDPSGAGEARRVAVALARSLGFDESETGKVALVVTEAATNMVKHAGGGELLIGSLPTQQGSGLEVVALDRGPGMANVAQCMRDGHSTAGSAGTGLGAIARLSDAFDIYSRPGAGTVFRAQFTKRAAERAFDSLEVGAVCQPKPGEDVCGDSWAVEHRGARTVLAVADGLGHGIDAAAAAREAVRVVHQRPQLRPAELLEAVHAALRSTRGAAVAVLEINTPQQQIAFAGLGNIAGRVLFNDAGNPDRHMVSHSGTAGHQRHRIQEFTYPWVDDGLIVLHSDGLATHWDLAAYPGLSQRHPSVIAAVLYRDHSRRRDDVTVVVLRRLPSSKMREPRTPDRGVDYGSQAP